MSFTKSFNTQFMPVDVIFPLKKMPFENIECYAPNNEKEYLLFWLPKLYAVSQWFGR